jgi:hypothetical protein
MVFHPILFIEDFLRKVKMAAAEDDARNYDDKVTRMRFGRRRL